MQLLNKQAKVIIEDYIRTYYPKIKVESGELSLMNCECHNNAYHYAKKENQQIYICLVKNTEKWIVHWINKKDDKFIDNTLGHFNEQSEYRLIREVSMYEFDYCKYGWYAQTPAVNTLNRNVNLPLYIKLLSDYRIL